MKGKCWAFGDYKTKKKGVLGVFRVQTAKSRVSFIHFKLNCRKTVEKTYLEKRKQEKRYR